MDMSIFDCTDCGINTSEDISEYYMVNDNLWAKYAPFKEAVLCIGCLEERMGRKLNSRDFPKNIPTNSPFGYFAPHSSRLFDRITKE